MGLTTRVGVCIRLDRASDAYGHYILSRSGQHVIRCENGRCEFNPTVLRNLSTTLRHRRFLFTDSFLLLWKWRVG